MESLVAQAGTMFGLALVATLVGPKGAVSTTKTPAPEGSNQHANRLSELVRAALKAKAERLVVFIRDEEAASSAAVRDVVAKYALKPRPTRQPTRLTTPKVRAVLTLTPRSLPPGGYCPMTRRRQALGNARAPARRCAAT